MDFYLKEVKIDLEKRQAYMKYSAFAIILFFLFEADYAYALMAPDFIMNIGSALFGFIAVFFIAISAIFSIFYRNLKSCCRKLLSQSYYKIIGLFAFIVLSFVAVIFISAYGFSRYLHVKHEKEYKEWASIYQEPTLTQTEEEMMRIKEEINQELAANVSSSAEEQAISSEAIVKNVDEGAKNREVKRKDFFAKNQHLAKDIANEDFNVVLKSNGSDYVILDARENIENEIGHMPGSVHIRYADLVAGRWQELNPEKFYYVFCWSGMRGSEVVDFLRSKNVLAIQLKEGAKGWYDYGGAWEGDIKFLDVYTAKKYSYLFSTKELKQKLNEGVILVDSRDKKDFDEWHYPDSVYISTMATPSSLIDKAYSQLPKGARTIIACDSYVNCFDAKLTAVELERRGYGFLGRYNKVYELK